MRKSCRHCGSPYRFNPCWWGITVAKGHDSGGGDPPCFGDMYDYDRRNEEVKNFCWFFVIAGALLLLAMCGYAWSEDMRHSNPWLLSWIPATCCVTNDCCWEVSERELRSLPDDEWEVKSTGQVRKRTAYSPDGKFYRCACDYDNADKRWVRHQGANTRCIFVPMRSARASLSKRRGDP